MQIRCDYCDNFLDDTMNFCPHCGAPVPHVIRSASDRTPRTIEAMQAFCEERGIPAERMRFFIGRDYREPRAFGIYKDADGNFTVYKNKSDGTRLIRYHGPDEAFAVGEIFQKMLTEVRIRKYR
ncbi:MAG: zinc ribbon domain-containing protein [Eubacterium sp.]|nr:zinc ribbon domain-containing protein [Eubacterium sp.]